MGGSAMKPLQAMDKKIELGKFMGSWYVLAHIPVFVEKNAHNAVETYAWEPAYKRFSVHYKFNEGSLDGKENNSYQRGWVHNAKTFTDLRVSPKLPLFGYTPLRLPYIITDLADDYTTTIIGYPSRSYLWIMSRTPSVSEAEYSKLIDKAVGMGYDAAQIRKVPQDTSAPRFPVPDMTILE
jgi:apolipoprotein D and lipocalin family protein